LKSSFGFGHGVVWVCGTVGDSILKMLLIELDIRWWHLIRLRGEGMDIPFSIKKTKTKTWIFSKTDLHDILHNSSYLNYESDNL
jgi:hypothetical protein